LTCSKMRQNGSTGFAILQSILESNCAWDLGSWLFQRICMLRCQAFSDSGNAPDFFKQAGLHPMVGTCLAIHDRTMKQVKLSQKQNQKLAGGTPSTVTDMRFSMKSVLAPSPAEIARRVNLNFLKQALLPWREIQRWLAAEAELVKEYQLARTLQASLIPARILPRRPHAAVQNTKSHLKANPCEISVK